MAHLVADDPARPGAGAWLRTAVVIAAGLLPSPVGLALDGELVAPSRGVAKDGITPAAQSIRRSAMCSPPLPRRGSRVHAGW